MLFKKKIIGLTDDQKTVLTTKMKMFGAEDSEITEFLAEEGSYESKLVAVIDAIADSKEEQLKNIQTLKEDISSPVGNLENLTQVTRPDSLESAFISVEKEYKLKGKEAYLKTVELYPELYKLKGLEI